MIRGQLYSKFNFKDTIFKKIEERESAGYTSLTDSDVMDILDACERNNIELSRKKLKRFGV